MPIYPFHQDNESKPLHSGPGFSRGECHEVFKEMVRAELRNGPLAPRRRKRLIQYAAALQLKPLEASRIITSISRAEHDESLQENHLPLIHRWPISNSSERHGSSKQQWPVWLKIILPLMAAFLLDRLARQMF